MKEHKMTKSPFTSKHVFTIIIARNGLRRWKLKAMQGFLPSIFSNSLFRTKKTPVIHFDSEQ